MSEPQNLIEATLQFSHSASELALQALRESRFARHIEGATALLAAHLEAGA